MHCPNCGILAPAEKGLCPACGLSMPELSELLSDKVPTAQEGLRVKKRKFERRGLKLWTCAGAVFYVFLYWAIISEIIIGKGHVLRGVVFLLVITSISLGGLLVLYKSAFKKRSAHHTRRKADPAQGLLASSAADLKPSVTDQTTELLEKDGSNQEEHG